ncbi:MAG TPA: hypothetical protein VJ570_13000 [Holophagaceae bacterium]|nr:hypothetical protein [Holophagaceae bacterium]
MEWLALKHPLLVHLPIATALLLPLPLLLAQRAGRGIKPWWNTCRYMAWVGVIFLLPTLVTGFAWGRGLGFIEAGHFLAGTEDPAELMLRRHQLAGLVTALLGLATLWSLYRGRLEHEGLGILALLLGTAWAAATAYTGWIGGHMAHRIVPFEAPRVQAPAPPPAPPKDPEAQLPLRALDFAALEPLHTDAFRSPAHDGLWARGWISPAAREAWASGQPLPPGAYAVLSTQVSRWGRPGPEAGPLYFLEIRPDGKPRFAYYWARVPEDRRAEFGGQSKVYLREGAMLDACLTCHAGGASKPEDRAPLRGRRR